VASSDGLLRAFSPSNGAQLGSLALPGGAAAPPAIARGVMYVVTRDGRLHAFQ
jgi:outer membrane protein assembly factor BamB